MATQVTGKPGFEFHGGAAAAPARDEQGQKRASVLFFTSVLGGGGAEKHMLRLINHFDQSKFNVSLAVARADGSFERDLSPTIRKYVLSENGGQSATLRMVRAVQPLRQVIRRERPDLVFSLMDLANLVSVLALARMPAGPRIVLGVQTPPAIAYGSSWNPVSQLMLRLIPRLYPRADHIVALSNGVALSLGEMAPAIREQISVIHNAGIEADLLKKRHEMISDLELPDGPLLVACGRLKTLKGFAYLIDALVEVRKYLPASLLIVGEGEERPVLEKQIARLDLGGCVRLLGFQENPFKYMAAADVFVLPSLYEGFGNVIVEAMACGVPVVATDCPYGPRDIISDGIDGILVPPANAGGIAAAIMRILSDNQLKKNLALKGLERANSFHAETIAEEYGNLFLRVISRDAKVSGPQSNSRYQ